MCALISFVVHVVILNVLVYPFFIHVYPSHSITRRVLCLNPRVISLVVHVVIVIVPSAFSE